jgi:hypothetical protein
LQWNFNLLDRCKVVGGNLRSFGAGRDEANPPTADKCGEARRLLSSARASPPLLIAEQDDAHRIAHG